MTIGLWVAASAASGADVAPQAYIEAEYIDRIARQTDWPDGTFASAQAPFTICLIGDDPFGDYIVKLAHERSIQGRPISLTRISDPSKAGSCHVLFISHGEDKRLEKILGETRGKPILTVSDTPGWADRGVMVNFYRSGDKVAIEINQCELARSRLRLSSKILRLSRRVCEPPASGGAAP